MKRASSVCAASASLLLASMLLTASASGPLPIQQQGGAADADPSAEVFAQLCSRCHDGARITAIRRTKTEWEEVITKMIERGAQGTEDEFNTVWGYLRRHYGKVYINSATTDEITTSLGLSAKDADAILAYKKAHGAFQDFDAVKKVPDIDVKTLEEHKDAVAF